MTTEQTLTSAETVAKIITDHLAMTKPDASFTVGANNDGSFIVQKDEKQIATVINNEKLVRVDYTNVKGAEDRFSIIKTDEILEITDFVKKQADNIYLGGKFAKLIKSTSNLGGFPNF